MKCPYCGFGNIAGVDHCDSCGQNLWHVGPDRNAGKPHAVHLDTAIADIPFPSPQTVAPTASLRDALRKMRESKVCCLLVCEQGAVRGILSERDFLYKLDFESPSALKAPVSSLMTANPECINATDSVAFALNRMSLGGFRHLPVLKDDCCIGVISVREVFLHLVS